MRTRRFPIKKGKNSTRKRPQLLACSLILALLLYRNIGNRSGFASFGGCEYPVETDTVVVSNNVIRKEDSKFTLIALTHSRATSLSR